MEQVVARGSCLAPDQVSQHGDVGYQKQQDEQEPASLVQAVEQHAEGQKGCPFDPQEDGGKGDLHASSSLLASSAHPESGRGAVFDELYSGLTWSRRPLSGPFEQKVQWSKTGARPCLSSRGPLTRPVAVAFPGPDRALRRSSRRTGRARPGGVSPPAGRSLIPVGRAGLRWSGSRGWGSRWEP